MKYWHETAVKFSRFSTYPKLLMDCGSEATAQSFRLTQQQHPGRFTKSEISCGRESGRPPASESDDLWIVSAAPTQLHLTGLEHVAVIFSLHRAPVRELAGGSGRVWGEELGGERGSSNPKPTTRRRHSVVACAAAHCLHDGEENSLTAFLTVMWLKSATAVSQ